MIRVGPVDRGGGMVNRGLMDRSFVSRGMVDRSLVSRSMVDGSFV